MKDINGVTVRHGDSVTCSIHDSLVTDAKIFIDKNDTVYICQDVEDGANAPDKLGYRFSWVYDRHVNRLKIVNRDYEIF